MSHLPLSLGSASGRRPTAAAELADVPNRCRRLVRVATATAAAGLLLAGVAVTAPSAFAAPIAGTVNQINATTAAATTTTLGLSNVAPVYGSAISATATVGVAAGITAALDGTMDFQLDGASLGSPVPVSNGSATIDLTGKVSAGNHILTASFSPLDPSTLAVSDGSKTFSVAKANQIISSFALRDGRVNETQQLSATGGGSTSAVTFAVDASTSSNCSISGGLLTLNNAGQCTVEADQAGDVNFNAAPTLARTLQVQPSVPVIPVTGGTILVPSLSGLTYGEAPTINASITGSHPGGTAELLVDGVAVGTSVTVSPGASDVSLPVVGTGGLPLGAGPHTLSVQYTPTGLSAALFPSNTVAVTVNQAPQTISFTAHDGLVGQTQTLTATGGNSNNPVTFSVDSSTAQGVCSVTDKQVSFLKAGNCIIDADQLGDVNFLPAVQVSQLLKVAQVGTNILLSLDRNSASFGQSVTASAKPDTAGSVQFLLDGQNFGTPLSASAGQSVQATFSGLGAGGHRIDATFSPINTTLYVGTMQSASLTIGQAGTSTAVTAGSQGLSAAVAAMSPGAGSPSGTVSFAVDGHVVGQAPVQNGRATLAYGLSAATGHGVSATYSGDVNFTASSGSTARNNPTITASVSGSRSRYGWYRAGVTVRFSCSTTTAPLTTSCPGAITLLFPGANRSVTQTIYAADGGVATVIVRGINIDRSVPTVAISGLQTSRPYFATAPKARCVARDALSGVASCTIKVSRKGSTATYVATATDRAGNVRTTRRSVQVATAVVNGASYRSGSYTVHRGAKYTVRVASAAQPRFAGLGRSAKGALFHRTGRGQWALTVAIPRSAKTGSSTIRFQVGHKISTIRVIVR